MHSLAGKTALVTGANSGIGLEASIQMLRLGARVVMTARDRAKGEAALATAQAASGSTAASLLLVDFASLRSVRELASAYRVDNNRLDILVNNAGSVNAARHVTPDGFEATFQVNYLGAFLLTHLLLDLLQKSAPSRVVNVSSVGHFNGTMDFDNLQFEKGGYAIMRAYGRSKLGNILFTRELAKRLAAQNVLVNCLHPGAVVTNIWSHAPGWAKPALALAKLFMISAEEGGSRIVYLAASPEVDGKTGGYYDRNRVKAPSHLAQDDALARRLWEFSAAAVGITAS